MSLSPIEQGKYPPPAMVRRPLTLVERADEATDIIEIYREMGFAAPEGAYRSYKIHCPFNYEHGDNGLDKNCRIYPPTHIFCFAMHGRLKPTYLFAQWKNIQISRAAKILLERKGLLVDKNYKARWNELVEESNNRQTKIGESSEVIATLQAALGENPDYELVEFSTPVRVAWSVVLAALDVLWARPALELEAIERWYGNSLKKLNDAVSDAIKALHEGNRGSRNEL